MEQLYIGAKWINSPRCMPGTILEEQRIHRDEEEVLGRCNISAASALHHLEHVHLNHVPNVVSAAKLEFQTEMSPRATELLVVDSFFAMMPDKWIARSLCHRNDIVKRHLQGAIAPLSHLGELLRGVGKVLDIFVCVPHDWSILITADNGHHQPPAGTKRTRASLQATRASIAVRAEVGNATWGMATQTKQNVTLQQLKAEHRWSNRSGAPLEQ